MIEHHTGLWMQKRLSLSGSQVPRAGWLGTNPFQVSVQQELQPHLALGTFLGHVAVWKGMDPSDPVRAILLSSTWADSVISDTEKSSGDRLSAYVRAASADSRFEFTGLPLGDDRVVVVSIAAGAVLNWADAVRVTGPSPQFTAVQTIFP